MGTKMKPGVYVFERDSETLPAAYLGKGDKVLLYKGANEVTIGHLNSIGWCRQSEKPAKTLAAYFAYNEYHYKEWIENRVPKAVDTYTANIGPEVSGFKYKFVRFALWLLRRCGVVVITGRARREE